MNRDDLIHIVRASADITGERRFVIVGSQSILGTRDDVPAEMLVSMEVDIYPCDAPEKAELIDGAIGDGSVFQTTFGYFAHGVGPTTAVCPAGWESRLVTQIVETRNNGPVSAECLEPHDLILAKCVAGRDRDWEFAESALVSELVEFATLIERAADLPIDDSEIKRVREMLAGISTRIETKRRAREDSNL